MQVVQYGSPHKAEKDLIVAQRTIKVLYPLIPEKLYISALGRIWHLANYIDNQLEDKDIKNTFKNQLYQYILEIRLKIAVLLPHRAHRKNLHRTCE